MKSKETGFGKRVVEGALALALSTGAANATEKDLNELGGDLDKTNKDAPALVDDVQGKTSQILKVDETAESAEKQEANEYDEWGFPKFEVESYQKVFQELISKELYQFLEDKSKEDGKQYTQYLDTEGTAFVDFIRYIRGYTSVKNKDGKEVKATFSNDPNKIAQYTPAGGSAEKIRGFKEELAEIWLDLEDFRDRGFTVSNLDTLKKNIEISIGTLNRGKESIINAIHQTETRTKSNNIEGVITQKAVKDSLNRIGHNIEQYYKDLRDNTVDPCIEGNEFMLEDVAMMIAYYKSQKISTSPDANGKHKPDRIKLEDWRKIQDANPKYQTKSYHKQYEKEMAEKFGINVKVVPEGEKAVMSVEALAGTE